MTFHQDFHKSIQQILFPLLPVNLAGYPAAAGFIIQRKGEGNIGREGAQGWDWEGGWTIFLLDFLDDLVVLQVGSLNREQQAVMQTNMNKAPANQTEAYMQHELTRWSSSVVFYISRVMSHDHINLIPPSV